MWGRAEAGAWESSEGRRDRKKPDRVDTQRGDKGRHGQGHIKEGLICLYLVGYGIFAFLTSPPCSIRRMKSRKEMKWRLCSLCPLRWPHGEALRARLDRSASLDALTQAAPRSSHCLAGRQNREATGATEHVRGLETEALPLPFPSLGAVSIVLWLPVENR